MAKKKKTEKDIDIQIKILKLEKDLLNLKLEQQQLNKTPIGFISEIYGKTTI